MSPPLNIILFFLFLHQTFSPASATHHPDIIGDTCKRCAVSSPNVNYDRCVASLRSVQKSHRSDLRGLALISVNLATKNASRVRTTAKKLVKAQPRASTALETCVDLFSEAISDLKESKEAIRDGRYDDANIQISAAVDAPGTCEDGFAEGNFKSPLAKEDNDFFQIAVTALAITALLQ